MSVAHDDELSVKRRVAMDAHLAPCDACRLAQDDLASLGIALRRGAAEHRPDDSAFAGLATEVLARTPVKQDASWRQRVRDVVEGGPGLWIMGGALASTMAVPLLVATMLNATPVQPGSLAGLLQTSVSLGSNGNPVWLAKGMTLPRVWPDTRAAAMLIQPFPPLLLEQLTLAAVVTREGQLASVRILGDGPPPRRRSRQGRLTAGVRCALSTGVRCRHAGRRERRLAARAHDRARQELIGIVRRRRSQRCSSGSTRRPCCTTCRCRSC